MRVTFNQVRDGLTAINTAAEQFATAQWQVSSGLRVRQPSDDPAAAQRAINDQADLDEIDAYKSVSASASSRLVAMDSALGNMIEKIQEALVALQSAQGSTATQTVRDAAATTFEGVRDALLADINTTIGGTHLFSGTNSDQAAYARVAGTWTYQGSTDPMSVGISEGRSVAITMDGQAIMQGSAPQDLLALVESLATAARTNDTATLAAGVTGLNDAFARVTRAQSQVGYDETSITDGEARLSSLKLAATARLSADRDANMAEAMTRMSKAQVTYEAALAAVAKSSRQSLLDYLK